MPTATAQWRAHPSRTKKVYAMAHGIPINEPVTVATGNSHHGFLPYDFLGQEWNYFSSIQLLQHVDVCDGLSTNAKFMVSMVVWAEQTLLYIAASWYSVSLQLFFFNHHRCTSLAPFKYPLICLMTKEFPWSNTAQTFCLLTFKLKYFKYHYQTDFIEIQAQLTTRCHIRHFQYRGNGSISTTFTLSKLWRHKPYKISEIFFNQI